MITPTETRRGGAFVVAATSFLLALAYFCVFVRYGINLPDEGALLHGFERMADGQRPYQDFHLGYTPGVYYVHSLLQGAFNQSIIPGRVVLALVNAGAAATLSMLAYPLTGGVGALVAALLYVAMIPVHPGFFAAFNVPYPTWYSVLIFLAGLLTCRRYLATPSASTSAVAGALAGLGFLFKPNIGAFQLACTMLLVLTRLPRLAAVDRARPWSVPALWWSTWGIVLLGVLAVFGFVPSARERSVFLLPVVACALLVARYAGHERDEQPARGAACRVAGVVVGFLAVTAPWVGVYAARLSFAELAEKVLFIGSPYAELFYLPHPSSVVATVGVVAVYLGALRAPAFLEQRGFKSNRLGIIAAAAVLSAASILVAGRPMVAGVERAVMLPFEQLWVYPASLGVMWLLIFTTWAAPPAESASRLVLTVGAVFLYLQIYPRSDFTHWVWAAPLLLVGFVYLALLAADRWSRDASRSGRMTLAVLVILPLVVIGGLRLVRSFQAVARLSGQGLEWRPSVTLASDRAPVWINIGRAEEYRDLAAVVELLQQRTTAADPIATFPALDLVSFLADRDSPFYDSYFFPGWMGHDGEAIAVAEMRRHDPDFVVVLYEHMSFFQTAPAYYYQLTDYIESRYRPFVRFGHYMVLARHGTQDDAPAGSFSDRRSDELSAYLRGRLAGTAAGAARAVLGDVERDVVVGHYPVLAERLTDPDPGVRESAVAALRHSGDPHTGAALFGAATSGALEGRARALALRLAGAWAGRGALGVLLDHVDDSDAATADAARTALAAHAERTFLESFWPGHSPAAADPPLTNLDRTHLREWLRDPQADPRLKSFAISVGGQLGGYDEIIEAAYLACDDADVAAAAVYARRAAAREAASIEARSSTRREEPGADAEDSITEPWSQPTCSPAGLAERLPRVLESYAPRPWARFRLLYGLVQQRADALLVGYVLDLVASDDAVAPRIALAALEQHEEADTILADRILDARTPRVKARLLWLAAVAGGPMCAEAAIAALEDASGSVRSAAAWVLAERGSASHRELLRGLLGDPDSGVRRMARATLAR